MKHEIFEIKCHGSLKMPQKEKMVWIIFLSIMTMLFTIVILINGLAILPLFFVFLIVCGGTFLYFILLPNSYIEIDNGKCKYRNLIGKMASFDILEVEEIKCDKFYGGNISSLRTLILYGAYNKKLAQVILDSDGIESVLHFFCENVSGSCKYRMGWIYSTSIQLEEEKDCLLLTLNKTCKWNLVLTPGQCVFTNQNGGLVYFDLDDICEISEKRSRKYHSNYIMLKDGNKVADFGNDFHVLNTKNGRIVTDYDKKEIGLKWLEIKPFVIYHQKKNAIIRERMLQK